MTLQHRTAYIKALVVCKRKGTRRNRGVDVKALTKDENSCIALDGPSKFRKTRSATFGPVFQ
jgi:ribosomal protein L14